MNTIELSLFTSRLNAVCDEMGAVLQRAAFSPNIRDRRDFSCAVFNADGELCAQAAHIPVHLGSMAYAMQGIINRFDWQHGDMVIVNDPFQGGTHLPDVTLISPILKDGNMLAFVANRAHHADIGAETPGSMPISNSLQEEGIILSPQHLIRQGDLQDSVMDRLLAATRQPPITQGDIAAQISANRSGLARIHELIEPMQATAFVTALDALNDYGERLARSVYETIPQGHYSFTDIMDDDGQGNTDIIITATLRVSRESIIVDFTGTADQVVGNINCPLSVAAAAVFYVFRCLLPAHAPACAGSFRPIQLIAPAGCLVNANYPAAVAAGNVETSTRIVDVIMGALAKAIPDKLAAASHGSMNNLAMGHTGDAGYKAWDYYETIGGGMGASCKGPGQSGVQTHMTNTLNTPIEVLESYYPVRIKRYALRRGSGGKGKYSGGDGIVREYEFLQPATVTLLTERRSHAAWGLMGGHDGKPGENTLNRQHIAAKMELKVKAGDCIAIKTPGGGGWGKP